MGTLGAGGSALSGHHLSLRSEPSQTKATHKRNLHFVKLAHTSKDAVKVNASVNFCLYLEGGNASWVHLHKHFMLFGSQHLDSY